MNWRWRHVIPRSDVFDEIIDMDHKIKKVIYGEWTSIKSTSVRMDSGFYSREGISDYELRMASRLPISVPKLNEYIATKAEEFNQARADYKDVHLCPFGCGAHRVGREQWEKRPDGVDYFINDRHFNIRRGNQSRQVLPAKALEVGDYVACVVMAGAGYELAIPDEICYVNDVEVVSDGLLRITRPRLVNTVTGTNQFHTDGWFVRLSTRDATGLVEAMKRHREALPLPPVSGRSSPSIGNNRIIDLGGL